MTLDWQSAARTAGFKAPEQVREHEVTLHEPVPVDRGSVTRSGCGGSARERGSGALRLAEPRSVRFKAGEQVRKEQGAPPEPEGRRAGHLTS